MSINEKYNIKKMKHRLTYNITYKLYSLRLRFREKIGKTISLLPCQ